MSVWFLLILAAAPHEARDADLDGFPDAAELASNKDRQNFRRWFVSIALSRYLYPDIEIADCAAFVRYAYREALKSHNEVWRARFGKLLDPSIPEIEAFHYPRVPFLGTDIFRVASGPYDPQDRLKGKLANFADVRHLVSYHTVKLGRRLPDDVAPGDLLFFTPKGLESHVMIYLELEGEPYVLYHTGPGDETKGELRLVKFATLMALEDETWRPYEANPAFRGFYRFKILD